MLNLRPLYGYHQEPRYNAYDAYVQQRIKMSRESVHVENEEHESVRAELGEDVRAAHEAEGREDKERSEESLEKIKNRLDVEDHERCKDSTNAQNLMRSHSLSPQNLAAQKRRTPKPEAASPAPSAMTVASSSGASHSHPLDAADPSNDSMESAETNSILDSSLESSGPEFSMSESPLQTSERRLSSHSQSSDVVTATETQKCVSTDVSKSSPDHWSSRESLQTVIYKKEGKSTSTSSKSSLERLGFDLKKRLSKEEQESVKEEIDRLLQDFEDLTEDDIIDEDLMDITRVEDGKTPDSSYQVWFAGGENGWRQQQQQQQ